MAGLVWAWNQHMVHMVSRCVIACMPWENVYSSRAPDDANYANDPHQSVEDMRQSGVSTTAIARTLKALICIICTSSHGNQHHQPMQNLGLLGQAKASTDTADTQIATFDNHPHKPVFSRVLAGSVSLLTDSLTNAQRRIYLLVYMFKGQ